MLFFLSLLPAFLTATLVNTPIGKMDRECVHTVPSHTHLVQTAYGFDATTAQQHWTIPHCVDLQQTDAIGAFPPDYDGWLAYTTAQSTDPFTAFNGSFTVPNSPTDYPDMLFSFTGLQNIDWIPKVDPLPTQPFVIIQPVLQYSGETDAPWNVRSWYVTLEGAAVSEPLPVQPGETIVGTMVKLDDHKGLPTWLISTGVQQQDGSVGKETLIHVSHERLAKLPWAYTTVECYGCSDCNYLPTNKQYFTNMVAAPKTATVDWVASVTPNPVCHTKATIIDNATVTYTFQ